MAPNPFDARTHAFLDWFKCLPGATFSDSITIVDLRSQNAGRGIIATEDIEADATLFTIPRKAIIGIETSELPSKLPQVFQMEFQEDDDAPQQDSWSCLILVMIYECLRGEDSLWKPYFDILPETFNTPMFWTDTELGELQASAVRAKVGRDEAESMFQANILPVVRGNPGLFPGSESQSDQDLIDLAHRMGSTIMSYAFDLDNDEDEEGENEDGWEVDKDGKSTMGMVPMADILNADAEFNAHVNHEDETLRVTALRPIKAGQEILNYYGPHPNSELLRRYGYVTEKHARYDVVEIPWDVVDAALRQELLRSGVSETALDEVRRSLQEEDEEEYEDTSVLERESAEPNSDGTFAGPASLTSMPGELEERLKEFLKRITKVHPGVIPDKRKRKTVSDSILVQTLLKLESRYATCIQEDQSILENNPAERQRMAVVVRIGEKRLLQEAKALFDDHGSNDTRDASATSNKRTRTSA